MEGTRPGSHCQHRRALAAGRDRRRVGDGVPRRDRRQRRAARHRQGPERVDQRPAVDPQRLPADAGVADPARRQPRRPARAAAGVPGRGRALHPGEPRLRGGAERRAADRGAARPGDRRRAADPRQPGDHPGQLPPRRPGAGDRRLVGARRRRHRLRAAARRLADRGDLLAGDLPDQPADRRLRLPGGDPARARVERPDRDREARPLRRGARGDRARRLDLRADRGAGRDVGGGRRDRGDRHRRADRLLRPGARARRTRCCRSRSSARASSAPPTG